MINRTAALSLLGTLIFLNGCENNSFTGAEQLEASEFVSFEGASEDKALVESEINQYLTVGEPKRIIYVAPFTEGSQHDGEGTKDDPKRHLRIALEDAEPGDHFYLAPGVYRMDKERDNFGTDRSSFSITKDRSGTREDKIVVTTDPALFDIAKGEIAQIDFGFDNTHPGLTPRSQKAIGLYASHWVFENLEIRNANDRIFSISGHYNLIRYNDIHHVNQDASNNQGLIVMARGTGAYHNVVMQNHLHHTGIIDTSTGNLLPMEDQHFPGKTVAGANGGCTYSEDSQHYTSYQNQVDAGYPVLGNGLNTDYSNWTDLSWATISQWITEPDDDVYYYNNLLDHCIPYGLGVKNSFADGKVYYLSNIIHQSKNGMKMTHSNGVIRNNIVYNDDGHMESALHWGDTPNGGKILGQVKNATNIQVTNNTFVGSDIGIAHRGGWNSVVSNNLFLDIDKPHHIEEVYYAWELTYGEYLYDDLNDQNPYFSKMPQALKDQVGKYKKLEATNNVYTNVPFLTSRRTDNIDYLPNNKISNDYIVFSADEIKTYLVNPGANDFRIKADDLSILQGIGSGIH